MLDEFLRPLIKRTLNVPTRASNDYIYGARKKGCPGDTGHGRGQRRARDRRRLEALDIVRPRGSHMHSPRQGGKPPPPPTTRDLEEYLDASQEGNKSLL